MKTSKSMPYNKSMSEALDRWLDKCKWPGGRLNVNPLSQSKGAGDNQSGLHARIHDSRKGAQCANVR